MSLFWQLPEPARYLRGIVEDLGAGSNVVLAIPDHTPDGCATALSTALSAATLPSLQAFQPNGLPPVPAIHELLGLGPCPDGATVMDLCDNPGFRGRVIHLQTFTSESWPPWFTFLLEYEDACRQLALPDRTLFVASLSGELALEAPAQANLLRVHPWLSRMDGLNTRLYATELLGASSLKASWHRQLAVATLAELALWDPEVVAAGASLPLAEILEPEPWLIQLALDRGWSAADDPKHIASKWRGLRQPFEGRSRTHSAWLALDGRLNALFQRLWTAQVSALFPLLERHRQGLLHVYGQTFTFPWPTKDGQIDHVQDLELKHIADQFWSQGPRFRETYRFVSWLRDIRNELAHLRNASAAMLLDQRYQSAMEKVYATDDD